LRREIIKDVIFDFPKASKERAEALAFKKLHWLKENEVRKEFYSG
jgi:hypothetical protein